MCYSARLTRIIWVAVLVLLLAACADSPPSGAEPGPPMTGDPEPPISAPQATADIQAGEGLAPEPTVAGDAGMGGEPEPTMGVEAGEGPTLTIEEVVQQKIESLKAGKMLFEVPPQMHVGVAERVLLQLTPELEKTLVAKTEGGVGSEETIEHVGAFMKAALNGGEHFEIRALSNESQVVPEHGVTEWAWEVKPLTPGEHPLYLSVAVRIKLGNGAEEAYDWPVKEKRVNVQIDFSNEVRQVVYGTWREAKVQLVAALAAFLVGSLTLASEKGRMWVWNSFHSAVNRLRIEGGANTSSGRAGTGAGGGGGEKPREGGAGEFEQAAERPPEQ
jgi:hypothetical protein